MENWRDRSSMDRQEERTSNGGRIGKLIHYRLFIIGTFDHD